MVEEDSLRGVTSNPAIFEKAILGSPTTTRRSSRRRARACPRARSTAGWRSRTCRRRPTCCGRSTRRRAGSTATCRSRSRRGSRTTPRARSSRRGCTGSLVARPNLMVKIPATEEGVPAIEQALYEGMNVNVTLLFSVDWHRRVMEAFVSRDGAAARRGACRSTSTPSRRSSSRAWTPRSTSRLEALGREDLMGRAGARQRARRLPRLPEVFHGGRFSALRDAGCPSQRPLWASTGVKNPRYPDTMYVDGLVGPETVNTMPLPTLLAAAEHAERDRGDGARRPAAGPRRAARGGHRPRRRHRPAAARGHRRVRRADEQAARRASSAAARRW